MAQTWQKRARAAGGVDVDESTAPVGVHVRLTVWRLDDHEIKPLRIKPVGQKQRAVVKVDRSAGRNDRGGIRFENGRRSGEPRLAERFASTRWRQTYTSPPPNVPGNT